MEYSEINAAVIETWIQHVRSMAVSGKIALKKHCLLRMQQRKISADELQDALKCAEVVEYYEDDRPFSSALVLGYTAAGRPLHSVVALDQDGDMLWIVTMYEPTTLNWINGFRQRRK